MNKAGREKAEAKTYGHRHLQHGFTSLLLERVSPEKNENRFYYLAWQPALFAEGTVVRSYGRKDGRRHTLTPIQTRSRSVPSHTQNRLVSL
jgi:hypothetical protein